ncbi:MAG: aspartate dehydrogenase domain-containing protein [Candidatus Omnitrophota bacterium]|nr:aspartate dehydrogenase domain-containing protein [Candidatus Omnitrophota bacterium]
MNKKTIGILGCGAIGTALSEYAEKNLSSRIEMILLFDVDPEKSGALGERLSAAGIAGGMEDLFDRSDIVIEAASPRVVPDLFRKAFEKTKDIMVMSIGGLLGNEALLDEARRKGIRVMLPTGAITGIDGVKAAGIAGIESVTLTTRKAPRSIKGAPYLEENKIDVDTLTGETVVFEGSAAEAIKGFPKNVNVSALLSIAGIGPERTKVRIVVSPGYTRNMHEIEVKSSAGALSMRTENVPSPENPKTSYLAALAAIASLKGYFDTVRIGT